MDLMLFQGIPISIDAYLSLWREKTIANVLSWKEKNGIFGSYFPAVPCWLDAIRSKEKSSNNGYVATIVNSHLGTDQDFKMERLPI